MAEYKMVDELIANGFAFKYEDIFSRKILERNFEAAFGTMNVTAYCFDGGKCFCVEYRHGNCEKPFKVKKGMYGKRAMNAIKATVENNGYTF